MARTADLPAPGSDEARAKGCLCPVLDNARGLGWNCQPGVYVIRGDCPLHADEMPRFCTCGDGIGYNATKCVTCTDAMEREIERLGELRPPAAPGRERTSAAERTDAG